MTYISDEWIKALKKRLDKAMVEVRKQIKVYESLPKHVKKK